MVHDNCLFSWSYLNTRMLNKDLLHLFICVTAAVWFVGGFFLSFQPLCSDIVTIYQTYLEPDMEVIIN